MKEKGLNDEGDLGVRAARAQSPHGTDDIGRMVATDGFEGVDHVTGWMKPPPSWWKDRHATGNRHL
jgi:hypothetical protein